MSRSGRETLLKVWKWLGGSLGCPGVVGRPSRLLGSGRETFLNVRDALLDIREWSEGPPGFSEEVLGPA